MKFLMNTAAISALVLSVAATGAYAQDTITGVRTLNDTLDDIDREVNKDIARANDSLRFGNQNDRMGLSGSASLSYSGKTGSSESQEFTAGTRLRYAQGQFVHTLGVAMDFADSKAGGKTKEDIFAVYDGNYYINDSVYGFVLGRVERDGLASTAGDTATDAFLGFGPGYRIVNTDTATWRVQAGVGISYLEDGVGGSNTETGYIVSSRAFYQFNDNIFATNDTDILKSDTALRVNNDLGLNFKMSDAFSTRVSYLSEYNDSRAVRTDNKLGLSLVYGF